MTTNLLSGNLQIAKVGDLWSDGSLLDSTVYLPQRDRAKVDRIRAFEESYKNEKVMGWLRSSFAVSRITKKFS